MIQARGRFSPKEAEIIWLIAADHSDKEVARALGISGNTLRTHLSRIYRRHGVHSRAAAVAVWLLSQRLQTVTSLSDLLPIPARSTVAAAHQVGSLLEPERRF